MKRLIVRLFGATTLACAAAAVGLAGASPVGADTSLIGWSAQSDANMFDLVVDNAAGLAGSHPLSEIDIPENLADFETGPLGHGLASIVWPGAVAGNAGSLLGEAGLPSQFDPVTSQLNDPIRAESFYPAGPTSATYPPGAPSTAALEMTSHADGSSAWAKSGIADASVPGLFDLKTVQGSSTATATDTAKSATSGAFQSLSLLDGMIQIGASASAASAQSDGNSPFGMATSHIGAITIGGQQVSVGNDGIVVGPASTNAQEAIPTALVNQFISAINLKITPLPETETSQAPTEQITSAGLQISFSLPQNLSVNLNCPTLPGQLSNLGIVCTLPALLDGFSYTLTIGRVTAAATAAPPFAISLDQGGLGLLDNGSTLSNSGVDLGQTSLPGTSSALPVLNNSVPNQSIRRTSAISLSSPIGAGLLIGLLAAAMIFGIGLRRLTGMLGAVPTDDCPLEDIP